MIPETNIMHLYLELTAVCGMSGDVGDSPSQRILCELSLVKRTTEHSRLAFRIAYVELSRIA